MNAESKDGAESVRSKLSASRIRAWGACRCNYVEEKKRNFVFLERSTCLCLYRLDYKSARLVDAQAHSERSVHSGK